ncbi:hypothetical protein FO519_002241 [Halicephalobus sp. NKZ332]|nr:hypothetical protein FO519_002241 [Halicephalobus sp. NKZ332]
MLDQKPLLLSVNGSGNRLMKESVNEITKGPMNANFHPLHLPPPTPTLLRPESEHSQEELQEIRTRRRAQYWPCGHCAFLLGSLHLVSGFILLGFDVFTNHVTQTPFAVTAALYNFMNFRRVDKAAQFLLVFFSFISLGICITIFIQSSIAVNRLCETSDGCYVRDTVIYSILLCISLVESTFCLVTLFVCFRSLSEAYFVPKPDSPFRTIIAGNFGPLKKQPAQIYKY